METTQIRRKTFTYGKSRKQLHKQSIFDDPVIGEPQITTIDLPPYDGPGSMTTKKRNQDVSALGEHHPGSASGSPGPRQTSSLKADDIHDSSDSSSSQSSDRNGSVSSSILDILDSDEEACAQQLQPVEVKRRKITPLNSRPISTSNARMQKQNPPIATAPRQRQKRPIRIESVHSVQTANATPHGAHATQHDHVRTRNPRRTSSKKSPHVQDHTLLQTQKEVPRTPRARRTLQERDDRSQGVTSPSEIGLTLLRLTPDKSDRRTSIISNNGSATPRRVRQKLIDRLDAPAGGTTPHADHPRAENEVQDDLDQDLAAQQALSTKASGLALAGLADPPTLPKNSTTSDGRSKTTYAKERSHLSGMVDELDTITASQSSRSQNAILPAPGQLFHPDTAVASEANENDDASAANAVKSIHELRQAGINNRFERDLETLFEDLEPAASPSKASVIQALLQLIPKLKSQGFARQFVEIGMTSRLARCAQVDTDTVSAVLLILALSHLFQVDHVDLELLQPAFRAIAHLSSSILNSTQPFTTIVRDRKQNFSKALIRDLVIFSSTISIGDHRDEVCKTPCHIALGALEHSLQTFKRQKSMPPDLPIPLFNQLLSLLSSQCNAAAYQTKHKAMRATLSILEFSAVSRALQDRGRDEEADLNYQLLGDVVTRIVNSTAIEHTDVKGIALRLVVSLTNKEPDVCAALAGTDLIPAVFSIVKQDLPCLSESADKGDEFNHVKLDSVIMALGCLLNLVDCSIEARNRMYTSSSTSSSNVQWLVSAFNDRAGKATEVPLPFFCGRIKLSPIQATTIAQSEVLVAFGYMSMLLCTLCLEDSIYRHVAQSVHGKDVTLLCVEAEEFLDKLETVASLNPDDPATSTFNERFRSILVSLSARIIS